MGAAVRILVIDGYTKVARDELVAGGASLAGDLYVKMLTGILPDTKCDVIFPSDAGAELPGGASLDQYDAVAWTGCSLTIFDDIPEVKRQIVLGKRFYESGQPSFGSCWGVQMAAVAAGGTVEKNPNGREMGIARKIHLTAQGRVHPLYEGKPQVFDAFISHYDEVTQLPPQSEHLATNAFTKVQSAAVKHGKGSFWGLQYHPEYDLHEMARLTFCRIDKLIRDGLFYSRQQALDHIEKLEQLHEDPSRKDIAWILGVDDDVLDPKIRQVEVRNWIEKLVLPNLRR